jgi:hypothetical protein
MGSQQTSSTTGTNFITWVRSDYNDTTITFFSATDMLEYLNDGKLDIVNKTHCLQTTEQITPTASTVESSITTGYIEVEAVQYYDGTKTVSLKKGSPGLVGLLTEETDTDAPLFWYEFAGKLGVYPILSAVTTQKYIPYLIKRPTVQAAGDAIDTPAIYDVALKYYMLARMALKDKNTPLYTALMNEYNQELGFYRKDLQDKQ